MKKLIILACLVGCNSLDRPLVDGGTDGGACSSRLDCEDKNPCTVDFCELNRSCSHKTVDCSSLSTSCTKGICNPQDGRCESKPDREQQACLTLSSVQGVCIEGECVSADPQCTLGGAIKCGFEYHETTADYPASRMVDSYVCAPDETGPEVSYLFRNLLDRPVTISLADTSSDVDLIVLEGKKPSIDDTLRCGSRTSCQTSSLTPGSGNESVTFAGQAKYDYLVVVDGKNGAKSNYTLKVECPQVCANPKPLACNMSMSGDTTRGRSLATATNCDQADPDRGPEEVYSLTTEARYNNYQLKLSELNEDLDLQVIFPGASGDCDGLCKTASTLAGTKNETATVLNSYRTFSDQKYLVLVDSKLEGKGSPYRLEVSCSSSCAPFPNASNYRLSNCSSTNAINDNQQFGGSGPFSVSEFPKIDSWGCASHTTGGEIVYQFIPPATADYTATLSGLSADLDLIVVEGTETMCDPYAASCRAAATVGRNPETITFHGEMGKVYWIAVDGKNLEDISAYKISLRSDSCPPVPCSNVDNQLSCFYREESRRNDDVLRSATNISSWTCDADTTGPEVVYTFKPTQAGTYRIDLDNLDADLDLILTSSSKDAFNQGICDSRSACVQSSVHSGSSPESIEFVADPNLVYFVAVDGKNGAVGDYRIRLSSGVCDVNVCSRPAPTDQGPPPPSLTCKEPILVGRNDQASLATSGISSWSCLSGLTGPERAIRFVPSSVGPYTIRLYGLTADLDLQVLEAGPEVADMGAPQACNPNLPCVKFSSTAGTADEYVTFTADPQKNYYVIIDGKNGAHSQYRVEIIRGCL